MAGPTERVLELLSLLQGGRDWPAGELAARLGTSPRTLRRDLDRLRELGYPVVSTRGPGGAYRLVAGRALPPLMFTDAEAVAAVVGLRHAALSTADEAADATAAALRKLEQALPSRLRHRLAAVTATTASVSRPGRAPAPGVVAVLATAARAHQHVRFAYTSRAGTVSHRRVEPYQQVLLGRRWYLMGWDQDRRAWRTFRLDRVADVSVPGTTFTPRPDRRPAFGTDGTDDTDDRPHAVVHFDAPAAVVAERLHAEAGTLTATGDHTCRYTTPPDDWRWLAAALAAVGEPYRVERPAELVEQTRLLATHATAATP
ncbi:MAG TPA: YafY family protein [Actinophytocola sp.]|nr:YafY family protein [Actinophytocola sp.]